VSAPRPAPRAVILAAGEGSRLRPLTDRQPKCLVELCGAPLLDRQVATLGSAGITDVTVVVGYRADAVVARGYRTVLNPDYAATNMVHSLFCARDAFRGDRDLLVAYGDIVYERRVLAALLASPAPVAVVSDRGWRRYWERRFDDPLADAETFRTDSAGWLLELGRRPQRYEDIQGQYVGLFKVRADRVAPLVEAHRAMPRDRRYDGRDVRRMYMTSFLQYLIDTGWRVASVPVEHGWLEVDSRHDLALYERLAREGTLGEFCRLDGVAAAAGGAAEPAPACG
jgi:choline kinase